MAEIDNPHVKPHTKEIMYADHNLITLILHTDHGLRERAKVPIRRREQLTKYRPGDNPVCIVMTLRKLLLRSNYYYCAEGKRRPGEALAAPSLRGRMS
ncbi:hypothetical protein EVAR_2640_1 [Eumeta japonica]|uniref:Uncharacterized protein n=1 Tax=Eumeta variegata TaxID=151549 RepID=A0A4C1SLW9_EUMVA|nr:hypothetical protein EVAR_2640_1 [Eumeta japonica]